MIGSFNNPQWELIDSSHADGSRYARTTSQRPFHLSYEPNHIAEFPTKVRAGPRRSCCFHLI